MKLLTALTISKVAIGQVPDGGWVTGPDNIDTSLQTCGFFDIGKILESIEALKDKKSIFRRWHG